MKEVDWSWREKITGNAGKLKIFAILTEAILDDSLI